MIRVTRIGEIGTLGARSTLCASVASYSQCS
jgi:hypothetical protein